ncbi:MAG: flagellar basal body-associated FliL family protein [Burkholderiales bacterium]
MSAAATSPAPEKPKGKLKFVVLGLVFLLLAAGGAGGAWFYLGKQNHESGGEHAAAPAPEHRPSATPTYMPLETMVVNLADPGGERVAQIGVTLDIESDKIAAQIKTMLPAIRSRMLMLVSQRSSTELLKRDGKEKLADDIAAEISRSLGYEVDEPKVSKKTAKGDDEVEEAPVRKRRRVQPSPVYGVLFSSFIVQ